MAVYVDDMSAPYRNMLMCHMIADSDDELHEMAERLGLQRRWHQKPPQHDSHYDIALSKRRLAVNMGAIEITLRQCAAMCFRRRKSGSLGTPEEAEAWYREFRTKENPQ